MVNDFNSDMFFFAGFKRQGTGAGEKLKISDKVASSVLRFQTNCGSRYGFKAPPLNFWLILPVFL
jgi:hypothetical protein